MHPLQVDARIVHKLDISVQEASGSTLKHTTMLESACIAVIKVGEKKSLHQPKKPRTIRKAPLPSKLARASPKLDDFKWMPLQHAPCFVTALLCITQQLALGASSHPLLIQPEGADAPCEPAPNASSHPLRVYQKPQLHCALLFNMFKGQTCSWGRQFPLAI
eukprot:scaffold6214_cov18-Tisochrysis_lutea.AAC.1